MFWLSKFFEYLIIWTEEVVLISTTLWQLKRTNCGYFFGADFISVRPCACCDLVRGSHDTSRCQVGPVPAALITDPPEGNNGGRHHVDRGTFSIACAIRDSAPFSGANHGTGPAPFLVQSMALLPSAECAVEPVASEVVLRVHPT